MHSSCLRLVRSFPVAAAILSSAFGLHARGAETSDASAPARKIDFNTEIRPIFNNHCVSCHGGVKQAGGLSLIRQSTAFVEADSGEPPIVPGDPNKSNLLARVTAGEDERMPPADHGPALSAEEIATLRTWIEQGASWAEHWAYVAPQAPALPKVGNESWPLQPLDRLVLQRLEAEKLAPAPEADRRTWLRRVTFDLVGLPPTMEEVAAFEADASPQAWETAVDRLLASPAFGERWATVWLDLARYADTTGFERDPGRTVWPYRDWLIRAFNSDMPYDQFTIKQLAGDLLDEPTTDDLIATVFHRNTPTNTEGGTDDEEFRTQAVLDRVNTTWQVWQATTFACTQCHSHPYAPFDNDEYYKFVAFFNSSRDCDLREELPLAKVAVQEQDAPKLQALERRRSEIRQSLFTEFAKVAVVTGIWRNLPIDVATSTGTAKLRLQTNGDVTEVFAEGTISNHPVYTLESPVPAGSSRMTALRIEALPLDLQAALRTPEAGFVLSRLEMTVVPRGDEKPRSIEFETVFAEEAEPLIDPEESLRKGGFGWAAYSRLSQPTAAVFLPKEPVVFHEGDRLRLTIRQDIVVDGSLAMFLRRARFSLSDAESWHRLVAANDFVSQRKELAAVTAKLQKIKTIAIPVMEDLPAHVARRTYQFERGNWLSKGPEVFADTPAVLPPLPADVPHNRLELAKWLVSAENPLTARVMVNRLWSELFGVGIVETAEDFGSSGSPPSNQELIDHLAVRFQKDLGWSVKRMLKEITLSATYRQSAETTAELRERDPSNQLLARGPRNRLTAEMVRDQALLASGLLAKKMFGPPVMPPQPEGVWRSVYNGGVWTTATGEDRYRRAVYTYCKRTSGYPSFLAFDAPSRDICSPRRMVTNTPLQALATLNDEAYIECAQALSKRMLEVAGNDIEQQFRWAYENVTNQKPSAGTINSLQQLYQQALSAFEANQVQGEKLGATKEEAARAVVGNAILNLDIALVR